MKLCRKNDVDLAISAGFLVGIIFSVGFDFFWNRAKVLIAEPTVCAAETDEIKFEPNEPIEFAEPNETYFTLTADKEYLEVKNNNDAIKSDFRRYFNNLAWVPNPEKYKDSAPVTNRLILLLLEQRIKALEENVAGDYEWVFDAADSKPFNLDNFLEYLLESIPTWPEYYEVQEDIYMKNPAYTTINMDGVIIDSQEGCYSIWIEKGTKICKGKPENIQ